MANTVQRKNHATLIIILLLIAAIIGTIVIYFGIVKRQVKIQPIAEVKIEGTFMPEPKDVPDFTLTDNRGNPFTKERLKDRWTLIFFGFTNCGYVCPTTLTELTRMYEMLQKDLPEKELPQVVLVSVDPERDSIEKMNDYVTAYHPTFIGVRSDTEGTQRITDQFHISAIKMQSEGHGGDHYMINHSAEIILINPDAKIQAYLSYPHKAEQLAKDYKLIVKRAV